MFCLLLPILSLFFWDKTSQFKQDELTTSIETIRSSLKIRGSSVLSNLSLSANQAVASYDFSTLNLMVKQVTSGDADIQYCLVMDLGGIAVAHSQESQVGQQLLDDFTQQTHAIVKSAFPSIAGPFANENIPVNFLYQDNNTHSGIMEAVAPIYNGSSLWGAVRCGYSLENLQQQIRLIENKWQEEKDQFTIIFVITVALFLILGISVTLYFTHYFSRAVKLLNDSVNTIAHGDLESRISSKHLLCTEFTDLATNINEMSDNLLDSRTKLDKYSTSLETLVAERTHKLELANKELESFSYSVSHDLRAPLRSIEGFSRILEEDYREQLGMAGNDVLNRVRKNTRHMEDLIDGLLSLSKVTRCPLHYDHVDMSRYAHECIDQLLSEAPDRKVEIVIAENLITRSDPNLLRAVITNLISNAWKYSSREPAAKIEFGKQFENDRLVYFIKDNGAGFDMAHVDKLFGAFQRLHKASEFDGSGIGLATVQRIMNRLGGLIWAESTIGKGAVFYFTLPG